MEGIPPHARDRETAEDLLGKACLVDTVEQDTCSRRNMVVFKFSAWTANPEAIPTMQWLGIPEPGLVAPLFVPPLLQYRVLIHVTECTKFKEVEHPWRTEASFDSGQSGLPDSDDDRDSSPAGGWTSTTTHPAWPMGVRDRCGGDIQGGVARRRCSPALVAALVAAAWEIAPMEMRTRVSASGACPPVKGRISTRVSAFDRLSTEVGREAGADKLPLQISNRSGMEESNEDPEDGATEVPLSPGREAVEASVLHGDKDGIEAGAKESCKADLLAEGCVHEANDLVLIPTTVQTGPELIIDGVPGAGTTHEGGDGVLP